MNKEEILNVGILCGGRSSQQTYNNFVKMYSYAKENGFKGINITFIDPELDKLQQENKQLKSVLNEIIDWKDKNGNRYIYQDSLGEDWYFYDLDVFDELGEILDKVGGSNE